MLVTFFTGRHEFWECFYKTVKIWETVAKQNCRTIRLGGATHLSWQVQTGEGGGGRVTQITS